MNATEASMRRRIMNDDPERSCRDRDALLRLKQKRKRRIEIVERYVHGRIALRINAEGYGFSWGRIVERPPNDLMIWDFHLDRVREAYVSNGLGIVAMQEKALLELEGRTDYLLRENLVTAERLKAEFEGWKIVPGAIGRAEAFSVASHFGADHFCRAWLIAEFIPEILPEVEQALILDLGQVGA
jgi:hypothetical protein